VDSAPFRPAYELYAALAWCLAAAGAGWVLIDGVLPPALFYVILAFSLALAGGRLLAVHRIWRQRAHLAGRPVIWIDTATLARKAAVRPGHIWLGWGFVWERTHRQRLHDLETVPGRRARGGLRLLPPGLPEPQRAPRCAAQLGAHHRGRLAHRRADPLRDRQ
jgi:conjugal transfer pilus assembly protein TraD